jgi:hypothetical protein
MASATKPLRLLAVIVGCIATGALVWMASSIASLRADLDGASTELKKDVTSIEGLVSLIRADLDAIGSGALKMDESELNALLEDGVLRTDADVAEALSGLGEQSTVEEYARFIAEVDSWAIRPEDASAVQERLAQLMPPFRAKVKSRVVELQSAALVEPSSSEGAGKLDEAGRILATYPLSEDPEVLKEAKQLADQQADVVVRLEGLRRQRYNEWALIQVARAIDYYNANASRWNPLRDNGALVGPLTEHLGSIDPLLLEPSVAELYGYIVGKVRQGLSDADKVRFAKNLIDPATDRKSLGDF